MDSQRAVRQGVESPSSGPLEVPNEESKSGEAGQELRKPPRQEDSPETSTSDHATIGLDGMDEKTLSEIPPHCMADLLDERRIKDDKSSGSTCGVSVGRCFHRGPR